MSNTSDTPDANEQVKPTKTRSRTTTRSKTESATADSQVQEAKPTVQRRTASTTPATTAVRTKSASETVNTQATPEVRPATTQPTTPIEVRPATTQPSTISAARSTTTQPTTTNTTRPATAQSTTTSAARSTTTQPSTTNTTRPATRPAATVGSRTNPAQRPTPVQRNSRTASPVQRQTSSAPAQRTAAPGSAPTRPGARPGYTSPGTYRPGGQGRNTTTRTGARPGTQVRRQPERRVPIVKEKPTGPISIPPQIVVKDLAELLHATPNEVIRGLIKHSIFASINQVVDYDKAALVAEDLGFEPGQSELTVAPAVQRISGGLSANEAMMATRQEDNMIVIPPVVTIMGHVDHGKTSLLDTIRKTKVAAGEAGGITQHIGAYQVEVDGKKITFLDTPGHEAFTAMRARGAQVTHIAVIVVAADDGVMPQTREAIDHARAAKVPIIIALNKIDKADANPDFVKQQLYDIGVVIEEFGGEVICVPVSARRGTGIDDLLEMILLLAEVQDIRANPNRPATGVIIEAKLEKNTGPTATVLVQQGTLKMGDNIVVGALAGKVRAMFNDRGKRIQKAPPSTPVSLLGLPEVPQAGDHL